MKQTAVRRRSPVRAVREALILSMASSLLGTAHAQTEVRRGLELDWLFGNRTSTAQPGAPAALPPEIAPPMEAPIDPAAYRLVPGDLLQLEVGGETDRAWRVAVSAEGRLLLPGAPSITASGHSLAEVTEQTRAALAGRFPEKPIYLHLLQPGSFRVPITGFVTSPGIATMRAIDRLSNALAALGGPLPGGSLRRIVVRDGNGSERTCDLVRFAHLGELAENPTLEPGMAIQVPPAEQFVRISGAVRGIPGAGAPSTVPNVGSRIAEAPRLLLEWREGDTIDFLIARAGGLSEDADARVLLLRGDERRVLALPDDGRTALEPDDAIEVFFGERYVYVVGAVRYPGPYAHLPSLSASDYVRLAGGPTEIGSGGGWKVRLPDGTETRKVGKETYLPPGATVRVPERWTYRASTLLAPISGVTALLISLVALTH